MIVEIVWEQVVHAGATLESLSWMSSSLSSAILALRFAVSWAWEACISSNSLALSSKAI